MRTKKAIFNTLSGFSYELIAVICGLIIPKIILNVFGSKYNGIIASISQFLSCIALMRIGIGSVTRTALYRALVKEDINEVSAILKSTRIFMRRIALIFVCFLLIFALFYPFAVIDEFEWVFTATFITIMGISTFVEYFFGIANEILLSADQMQYVISSVRIVTTILNTILTVVCIKEGAGIHLIKLFSALIYILNPLAISWYVKRKYAMNYDVEPNVEAIGQRLDAAGHEIAYFVNNNTDIMVLAVFSNVLEVSVYTVYANVLLGIKRLAQTFVNGFDAAFGSMYAQKEFELLELNFRIYELIVYSLISVIYTVAAIMFIPYVRLYTSGIADINYERPLFAYIITLAGVFSCIRAPYQNLVMIAGHYKQTRNGAIFSALLNIAVSVSCVAKWGLVGVAIGTLAADSVRTIENAVYMSRVILKRKLRLFIMHVVLFFTIFTFTNVLINTVFCLDLNCDTVLDWIINAVTVGIIVTFITLIADILFYRADLVRLMKKLFNFREGV